MVGHGDRLAGIDLSTAVSLPLWQFVVIAALVGLVSTLLAGPGSFFESKGGVAVRIALVLVIAVAAAWALDHTNARDIANERRALNAPASALPFPALIPGSSLSCLHQRH